MGLTSITIENFKGIGAPVTIPLRPITLLFGANSAGKSTVIQALQYAWEVLENRNADVHRTGLGDEAIDLGGFRNLVHKHDLNRTISITLEYKVDYKGGLANRKYYPEREYVSNYLNGLVDESTINVNNWFPIDQISVSIETAWDALTEAPYISLFEVAINGEMFGSISFQNQPIQELRGFDDKACDFAIDRSHPFFWGPFESSQGEYSEYWSLIANSLQEKFAIISAEKYAKRYVERYGKESAREMIRELKTGSDFKNESTQEVAESSWTLYQASVIPQWGQILYPEKRGHGSIDTELACVLSQFICGAGESVLSELDGLRYLGPLRTVPDRSYLEVKRPRKSSWANGLKAWDTLLDADKDNEGNVPFIDECNEHIRGTLSLDYTLYREDLVQIRDNTLANVLMKIQESPDSVDDATRQFRSTLLYEPRLKVLKVLDTRNGVEVAPMDIGVGIPQTLPVVVGAVDPGCRIFAVEQPELHVHPAIQSKIADLFIKEAIVPARPKLFLLETHSEHLILRILRRIRETSAGETAEGFPDIHPNDVQVIYVDADENGTKINLLEITPDGDFAQRWPNGFFREREEDLF